MSRSIIHNVRIKGCAVTLGENEHVFEDTPEFYNNDPALLHRLKSTIGFGTRRVACPATTTADLCLDAARRLLQAFKLEASSIDAIVSVTQTPDHIMPGNAHVIHSALGMPEHTAAVDVELGCSGYIYGLWLSAMMASSGLQRVLLVCGDTLSKLAHVKDRTLAPLFGDAGSATLIEKTETAAPMYFILRSDGSGLKKMYVEAGAARQPSTEETRAVTILDDGCSRSREHLFMDGFSIFEFTMNKQPGLLRDILDFSRNSIESIDFFVMHQANKYIVETITKKAKIPAEKAPSSGFSLFGNQNSASIPGVLCGMLREPLQTATHKCVLQGFGAGLSWGACQTAVHDLVCLTPVVYSGASDREGPHAEASCLGTHVSEESDSKGTL